MALQLNINRSSQKLRLLGSAFAVLTFFIQSLIPLNVPAVFAATDNISQLAFTNPEQSVGRGVKSGVLTV